MNGRRERRRRVPLPSPGVRFGADYLARIGRLTARLASQRERREGEARARLQGVGSEFVGYRPYRSGEDLRSLDWNLLARLGRPFVRVAAREASESWAVLLDASASMGTGVPGKLQLAAETAGALAALGLARRASVELWISNEAVPCVLRRKDALRTWMGRLERCRAEGAAGIGALVGLGPRLRGVGRVFLIGDFLDCEPSEVFSLARPSRELCLAQILAREELAPPAGTAVRWIDAETGSARAMYVDGAARTGYEGVLAAELERWRSASARARAARGVWASTTPFESLVQGLCG